MKRDLPKKAAVRAAKIISAPEPKGSKRMRTSSPRRVGIQFSHRVDYRSRLEQLSIVEYAILFEGNWDMLTCDGYPEDLLASLDGVIDGVGVEDARDGHERPVTAEEVQEIHHRGLCSPYLLDVSEVPNQRLFKPITSRTARPVLAPGVGRQARKGAIRELMRGWTEEKLGVPSPRRGERSRIRRDCSQQYVRTTRRQHRHSRRWKARRYEHLGN